VWPAADHTDIASKVNRVFIQAADRCPANSSWQIKNTRISGNDRTAKGRMMTRAFYRAKQGSDER